MVEPNKPEMFLGRRYDCKTDSYVRNDGTGQITGLEVDQAVKGRDIIPLLDVWHLLGRK